MVNSGGNAMWLIRQAISFRCLGGEGKKGRDQKSGSVTVNKISPQKEAEQQFAHKWINWSSPQLKLIIGRALLWHV